MSRQKPDPARPRPRRTTVRSGTHSGNARGPQGKLSAQPAPDDRNGWKTYWEVHQQPWRTEPEIDTQRQEELAKRRATACDVERGIYLFSGMKLTRADIEWLLATHENGRGPVDWADKSQREREGLDLRGADLCKADLSNLPLAGVHGGLTGTVWLSSTPEQDIMAVVQMENTILIHACLQGARLNRANLKGANLFQAHLESAELNHAHMEGASLLHAHMEKAQLRYAHLEEVDLRNGHLEGADLRRAFFNSATRLDDIILGVQESDFTSLVDISWEGANLAVIDWSHIKGLDIEHVAIQQKERRGEKRLNEYKRFVRANRQLAVVLQAQGLNEDAARFAYRANVLQRKVLWFQIMQPKTSLRLRVRKLGAWVFSHLLNLVAGYGYRPERSFLAYLLVVFGFMGLYLLTSHFTTPHLRWDEALVLSLSSFHGRGFFTQTITLGDPYARLAVTEAVLGLFIEISFIATFTQRFFGK